MTKGPETYSIAEAAELLGLSRKTVRRRIHKGELPAAKEDGPYGPEYRIPAEAINTAQQIIDVVKVERTTDPRTLALAIVQALETRDQDLQDEVAQLRQQVTELTETLESYRDREAERDRWLVEELRKALDEQKQQDKPKRRRWRWPWEKEKDG